MNARYLVRIGFLILVLAAALTAVLWLRPDKAKEDKWRFFLAGHASASSQMMFGQLVFPRSSSAALAVDDLALLPGGLAYLPKNASPLFGRKEAKANAVADEVLEPEKCLLVKSVRFERATATDSSGGGALLTVDGTSRLSAPSSKLKGQLSQQCAAASTPECQIAVWIEARPRKCE